MFPRPTPLQPPVTQFRAVLWQLAVWRSTLCVLSLYCGFLRLQLVLLRKGGRLRSVSGESRERVGARSLLMSGNYISAQFSIQRITRVSSTGITTLSETVTFTTSSSFTVIWRLQNSPSNDKNRTGNGPECKKVIWWPGRAETRLELTAFPGAQGGFLGVVYGTGRSVREGKKKDV